MATYQLAEAEREIERLRDINDELLAACELIESEYGALWRGPGASAQSKIMGQRLEAAIAKARGEAGPNPTHLCMRWSTQSGHGPSRTALS